MPDFPHETYLEDHPLHLTRYSARPCKRRIKNVMIRRDLWKTNPSAVLQIPALSFKTGWSLTFRIRCFSMLSTAKTCSPTAGSSIFVDFFLRGTRSGGGEPGLASCRQTSLPRRSLRLSRRLSCSLSQQRNSCKSCWGRQRRRGPRCLSKRNAARRLARRFRGLEKVERERT